MNVFLNLPTRFKNLMWQIAIVFVLCYFAFYTFHGDRGLFYYLYLNKEIAYAKQVAMKYHNERVKLENKIQLLSAESLDLDLLDERAKAVLNLMKSDEFIIIDEN